MTTQVQQIYEMATKDKLFLKTILEADGDKKPGFFSDEIEKILFSTMYYGWFLGKYGFNPIK